MTEPDITPTETKNTGPNWSLYATFASGVGVTIVFAAWAVNKFTGGSGSGD